MSKAFIKENDENEESDIDTEVIPSGQKNYITPFGFERMRTELKDLLNVKRPELVKTVAWAASNGDRSENADYIYGKRRLREIDRRIRFLTKRIESAEVIDPEKQSSNQVLFGATVDVLHEDDNQVTYRIVGIDESDPSRKYVSWISPIAKALLNAKKGDVVVFKNPKGEEDLEIIDVRYEKINF